MWTMLVTAATPVDADIAERWGYEDMQTFVAEDFQCSMVDVHAPADFNHTLADDNNDDVLTRSAASFEHSSTVRSMRISLFC